VSVTLSNDEVNVSFHATHPATREALESSLPRLRELLSDAGLSLGNASVSQQFAGNQRTPERPSGQANAGAPLVDEKPVQVEAATASTIRVGLLDAYA
jgi:flagellar hook-length control protein FliK